MTFSSEISPPSRLGAHVLRVNRGRLLLAFCLTAVLSLSVHAVMLQLFDVPYPSAQISSPLPDIVNSAIAVWAAIWLFAQMRRTWPHRSRLVHAGILFVLVCGLNETLRGWFMNGYCTSARGWLFFATMAMPALLVYAATAVAAALVERVSGTRRAFHLAALAVSVLLGVFAFAWVSWGKAALFAAFGDMVAGGGWCRLPYGMNVLVPAYLTFIEPALACLMCCALASPSLCKNRAMRTVQFMFLTLALKKQLLMSLFYAIYAPLPFASALVSMGQFTLEAAVLGAATAVSWTFARNGVETAKPAP
ncbi:hypothetical protein GWC77_20170 [Paraburkholderia sp. NMBU_R16]|uniref:hypothetical protein n=1 Tax=Paraburkholderia sp. NMBU_R16 TaxID=2698676 RepID=UPI0015647395|nr:hypothetical protein [Paraburkholderia sp. NMBU_R16]NRO98243.1 hypothetical protein [Paraburkholderia sp. NMBU_R16]